jgi:hypothetical protein
MAEGTSFQLVYKGETYERAAAGLRALSRSMETKVDTLAPVLREAVDDYLDEVILRLEAQHGEPWPGGTSPSSLSVRSGELLAGLRRGKRTTGTRFRDITGRIVVPDPYAIHEFGGVVSAEKTAYLTIPLPAAMDSRGVPIKRSARDWTNTFVRQSKAGNLIIFQRRGRVIVPLYVLKREVRLPPRLGVAKALQAEMPGFIERATDRLLSRLVGTA